MNDPAVAEPKAGRRRRASGRRASLYETLDWLLVRAPLRPIESYLALTGIDVSRLAADEPEVRRALAVGGGELLDALERPSASAREAARNRGKLLRYLIRMSTRPTPYGVFAGVALAEWGETTELELDDAQPRTRTRPDMAWLLDLVFSLEARPEIRRELRLAANPAALVHAGRVFLDDPAAAGGGRQPPSSMRATGAVLRALDLVRRPIPYRELAADLEARPGATPEKVEALLTELWQRTVLLTDLRPPLSAGNPADHVAARLRDVPAAKDALASLEAVLAGAAAWDALPPEAGDAPYRELVALAGRVDEAQAEGSPLQVDMAIPLRRRRVAAAIGDEARRGAELLLRLGPFPHGLPHLAGYRSAFESRYSAAAEVPLLELLDPRFGLGPPSGHGHGHGLGIDPARATTRAQTLQSLALGAARDRQLVVDLDEDTLARLETWPPAHEAAPASLELAIFVLASSAAAIDAGDFQVMIGPNIGASVAGRNLGRFADLLAPEGEAALAAAALAEARHEPNRLWVELVYLPARLRSANVVVRPTVRSHEIVLGTSPGVPAERTIPLDELVVGVANGGFYVRWPAENVEIVACAGHMLNNANAPEAFRFLENVARERAPQLSSFDWGPASGFPFLPRVQTGRIILSPAEWRIDGETRRAELAHDSPDAFAAALAQWRRRWHVPDLVYMTVGDNRLLLDLRDAAQAEELRAEVDGIGDTGLVVLQEALPGPEHAWAQGPGGRYVTELVVPLVLGSAPNGIEAERPARVLRSASADRLRPPGSDWLFAKLYCATAFEEDLIAGPMRELCETVRPAGLAEEWFFLRYSDPDTHLRLRFRGDPQRLQRDLLPQLTAWAGGLIGAGLCTRFCLDTYEREVDRYGGEAGIELAERVFAADSRAVVELVALAHDPSLELDRTILAVLGIDDLLAGLGLTESERLEWYRERVRSRHETGPDYRRMSGRLRSLLGDPEHLPREPSGPSIAAILAERRNALAPIAERFEALRERGELGQPWTSMLLSFVHLHCNRLTGTGSPVEEQALGLLLRTREGLDRAPVRPTA